MTQPKNKKLAIAILNKDMSCVQLAKQVKCSPSLISMFLHGWREPAVETAKRIESVLECEGLFATA